jgi:hypothetical protein
MKNYGDNKHSLLKHMLHMVICCGLPIVIVGFLPLIARLSPGAGIVIGRIAPFLCPIMMVAIMVMMMGGNKKKGCCDNSIHKSDDKEIV